MPVRAEVHAKGAVLANDHIRLELHEVEGAFVERVLAQSEEWQPVFHSLSEAGNPELDFSPRLESCRIVEQSANYAAIECQGKRGSLCYLTLISLGADDRYLHFQVEEEITARTQTRSLMSRYAF